MFISSKNSKHIALDKKLTQLGRKLRINSTPAETELWKYLRHQQLGYKFRRQYPLYKYILDFFCPAKKLIIEVDGSIHETQKAKDQSRDETLRQHGYITLRFTNQEVFNNTSKVLEIIKHYLNSHPLKGEEMPEGQRWGNE